MASTSSVGRNHRLQNVPTAATVPVGNAAAASPSPPRRGRPAQIDTTLSLSPPSSFMERENANPSIIAAPPPDDVNRCKRNGSGGWRCPLPRIPGKIFCEKHYQYNLKRKERARAAKKAASSPAPAPAIPPAVEAAAAAPTAYPFQAGEIWALHDIPGWKARFYARIERIFPSTARVELTHLVPEYQEPGLILACSTFHIIPNQPTTVRPTTCLSYRVASSEAAAGKTSFEIFPNAGEVWAVYNSPEPNAAYRLVEIVSGFTEDSGVTAAPLVPAERVGFRRELSGQYELRHTYFRDDLLWFSHRVQAVRTEEADAGPGVGRWQIFA